MGACHFDRVELSGEGRYCGAALVDLGRGSLETWIRVIHTTYTYIFEAYVSELMCWYV